MAVYSSYAHSLGPVKSELKSWPMYFSEIISDIRSAEVRVNDRNYRAGDLLLLREWNPDTGVYTGRECMRRVVHVLRGVMGVMPGYVVLSLGKVART